MTNEEAKANLEKLLLLYNDGMIDFSVIRESVKTAIEALRNSPTQMSGTSDLIRRDDAVDALRTCYDTETITYSNGNEYIDYDQALDLMGKLPSAEPESTRTFVELVVKYPDPELCAYKEYKGKPYYSIKYIENGKTYVGYGTYNPKVLSQYLKEYFTPSAQPDVFFWKKRAQEYESICANLASQLAHGTKFNHMVINENGIELSTQPDWNEMLVICDNCGHAIHVKAERRTDE